MESVFYSMVKAIPTNYEKEKYKLVDFGVKKIISCSEYRLVAT